jgi:branched-subunit amino acid transport protein
MMWFAILAGSAGCYALKAIGLSVPDRLLTNARVQRIGELLPVTLLAALIATQTFGDGRSLVVDARAGGLVVAIAAVALRAPFIVVVMAASAAAALLRLA